MPDRKVVNDFQQEIKKHLEAIKNSGTMNADANAIHQLCLIFEQVTLNTVCLSCPRELAKVHKYFIRVAKKWQTEK